MARTAQLSPKADTPQEDVADPVSEPSLDDDAPDEAADAPIEAQLEDETGLDLSEARPLETDHLSEDEESERVIQPPD
ncbi:hypothetical protein PGB34_12410 [Xenophilus arseniciresistens]|uniref:Uncharacterized protein n=1 Tax=Xenophilus arseniciresistens TaxID=1283306 RepID=A0AAE3NCP8_9BURK|nr:hypothetical protein [Xenophilus arseniciresistens]MDA7417164.1 hypothetical protein [Xenophilus arseniciresistens]